MSRQRLVAILYSQVRSEDRWPNSPRLRQAEHEGFLECVLGVLQGPEDAVAVHLQLVGVALDQVAERVVVANRARAIR